ncbi:hypothetical protein DUNSADRAFT_5950 [Dunaliella salina]|uniref:Uncharacterized protein n=1 Tax=Dunaliella salina TaxID=3046 RepID=A0ABQ7GPB4_DUNSA|nr:hypothetical protein DUNSADRAFT_5950 [Dunaliella salina]|eukprot:KAF5836444.1 hypothetical protein DUNSADRAFT_5950 [Dunaliella salina]
MDRGKQATPGVPPETVMCHVEVWPEDPRPWSTDLFACDSYMVKSIFLHPCLVADAVDGTRFSGLSDEWCEACCCGCLFCLNAPWAMFVRRRLRHKYGFKGSIASDFFLHLCCPCCAFAQMKRELIMLGNEGRGVAEDVDRRMRVHKQNVERSKQATNAIDSILPGGAYGSPAR